jgi:hypothetical protein
MGSYGIEFELSSGVMKDDDMANATASKTKSRSAQHRRKAVHEAVAGIHELRKQILDGNKGKPQLTTAGVKSWIAEGRR